MYGVIPSVDVVQVSSGTHFHCLLIKSIYLVFTFHRDVLDWLENINHIFTMLRQQIDAIDAEVNRWRSVTAGNSNTGIPTHLKHPEKSNKIKEKLQNVN